MALAKIVVSREPYKQLFHVLQLTVASSTLDATLLVLAIYIPM